LTVMGSSMLTGSPRWNNRFRLCVRAAFFDLAEVVSKTFWNWRGVEGITTRDEVGIGEFLELLHGFTATAIDSAAALREAAALLLAAFFFASSSSSSETLTPLPARGPEGVMPLVSPAAAGRGRGVRGATISSFRCEPRAGPGSWPVEGRQS